MNREDYEALFEDYEALRAELHQRDETIKKLERVERAAREVSDGWHMARGDQAHHVGCRCGGVFTQDALRVEEAVSAGRLPPDADLDLHTCVRLDDDAAALRSALSVADLGKGDA